MHNSTDNVARGMNRMGIVPMADMTTTAPRPRKPGPILTYFVWLLLTLAMFGGAIALLWSVTQ